MIMMKRRNTISVYLDICVNELKHNCEGFFWPIKKNNNCEGDLSSCCAKAAGERKQQQPQKRFNNGCEFSLSQFHLNEKNTQALLTTIVLAFVITNSLRVGINIYEAYMVRNITYLSLSLGHRSDTNAKIYISLSFLHLMKI